MQGKKNAASHKLRAMSCGEDVNQEEAVSRELRAASCKLWEDVNQPEAVSSELRAVSTTCQVSSICEVYILFSACPLLKPDRSELI